MSKSNQLAADDPLYLSNLINSLSSVSQNCVGDAYMKLAFKLPDCASPSEIEKLNVEIPEKNIFSLSAGLLNVIKTSSHRRGQLSFTPSKNALKYLTILSSKTNCLFFYLLFIIAVLGQHYIQQHLTSAVYEIIDAITQKHGKRLLRSACADIESHSLPLGRVSGASRVCEGFILCIKAMETVVILQKLRMQEAKRTNTSMYLDSSSLGRKNPLEDCERIILLLQPFLAVGVGFLKINPLMLPKGLKSLTGSDTDGNSSAISMSFTSIESDSASCFSAVDEDFQPTKTSLNEIKNTVNGKKNELDVDTMRTSVLNLIRLLVSAHPEAFFCRASSVLTLASLEVIGGEAANLMEIIKRDSSTNVRIAAISVAAEVASLPQIRTWPAQLERNTDVMKMEVKNDPMDIDWSSTFVNPFMKYNESVISGVLTATDYAAIQTRQAINVIIFACSLRAADGKIRLAALKYLSSIISLGFPFSKFKHDLLMKIYETTFDLLYEATGKSGHTFKAPKYMHLQNILAPGCSGDINVENEGVNLKKEKISWYEWNRNGNILFKEDSKVQHDPPVIESRRIALLQSTLKLFLSISNATKFMSSDIYFLIRSYYDHEKIQLDIIDRLILLSTIPPITNQNSRDSHLQQIQNSLKSISNDSIVLLTRLTTLFPKLLSHSAYRNHLVASLHSQDVEFVYEYAYNLARLLFASRSSGEVILIEFNDLIVEFFERVLDPLITSIDFPGNAAAAKLMEASMALFAILPFDSVKSSYKLFGYLIEDILATRIQICQNCILNSDIFSLMLSNFGGLNTIMNWRRFPSKHSVSPHKTPMSVSYLVNACQAAGHYLKHGHFDFDDDSYQKLSILLLSTLFVENHLEIHTAILNAISTITQFKSDSKGTWIVNWVGQQWCFNDILIEVLPRVLDGQSLPPGINSYGWWSRPKWASAFVHAYSCLFSLENFSWTDSASNFLHAAMSHTDSKVHINLAHKVYLACSDNSIAPHVLLNILTTLTPWVTDICITSSPRSAAVFLLMLSSIPIPVDKCVAGNCSDHILQHAQRNPSISAAGNLTRLQIEAAELLETYWMKDELIDKLWRVVHVVASSLQRPLRAGEKGENDVATKKGLSLLVRSLLHARLHNMKGDENNIINIIAENIQLLQSIITPETVSKRKMSVDACGSSFIKKIGGSLDFIEDSMKFVDPIMLEWELVSQEANKLNHDLYGAKPEISNITLLD